MRIAIDAGGTFTDCVFVRRGRLEILKVPSTPGDPARAVAEALAAICGGAGPGQGAAANRAPRPGESLDLICGTTVGTNALLERRGGRVALITTAGFEDVLEIGRQARPRLYDFFVQRAAPLVPREMRFGLRERVTAGGRALLRPSAREIEQAVGRVRACRPEAVAVCLLFSFLRPRHERAVAAALRRAGFAVSVSHEILPELREYERTATTVVNACLVLVMSRYLEAIEARVARTATRRRFPGWHTRIMQSSGGIVSARVAAREPVRTILSGPAGGVIGAQYVAELAGFSRVISFDMGGTSTDVALLDGAARTTNEAAVADIPVAVPLLDIHTVGAGGGSIARFDRAGALRVGPESAGADPGPVCYGRGELPTVTDAHVILGRIPPRGLLGGGFPLEAGRSRRAFQRLKGALRSPEVFAQGIIDVANATMEKAIRVISIERGHDPRDYTLVAFGGAGALHACELAAALRMPRVLVPRFPGGLSALGILRADVVRDVSQTVRLAVRSAQALRPQLAGFFAGIERAGRAEMRREGFSAPGVSIERWLDLQYVGQAFVLTVPAAGDFVAAFHRAHFERYGYADAARAVEVVTVRSRLTGRVPKPGLARLRHRRRGRGRPGGAEHSVIVRGQRLACSLYERDWLRPGDALRGPCVVAEYSATTFLPPGWRARVDDWGNLVIVPLSR
jgi:N-methylhydantoinase A